MDSAASFITNLIQVLLYAFGITLVTIGMSFTLKYFHAHVIKADVENYMLDVLAYGTKHNGFNDPEVGSYTFDSMREDLRRRYKLEEYIVTEKLTPDPDIGDGQVYSRIDDINRKGEISIEVTYQYPTLNPFKNGEMKPDSPLTKTISNLVHGYVKETETNKTQDLNKPWWLWKDEEYVAP